MCHNPIFRCLIQAFLILAFTTAVAAQNLVPNPGFETYTSCPTTIGQTSKCVAWSAPTTGTSDYFHACHTGPIVGVPANTWGTQAAHGGNAYASFIVYVDAGGFVGEYLEVALSSPLVSGEQYDVSFWVSLCDKSRWAIAELGAYLSVGSVAVSAGTTPLPYTPQVENLSTNVLADKSGWTQISGTVTANGGETHLVLGSFKDASAMTTQFVGGMLQWANYYVDDVNVSKVTNNPGFISSKLIGWSDAPAPTSAGYLDIQDVDNNCRPAFTRCRTSSLQIAVSPYAGGTAYDARHQSVWASDGIMLAEYLLDSAKTCNTRCNPFPAVRLSALARVSGLAHSERSGKLIQLATSPGAAEITSYNNHGPCPGRSTSCRLIIPATALAAGLAHDEVSDLLFIAVSTPNATNGWDTEIWVSQAAAPCQILCKQTLFSCTASLVTGLAYESCKQRLYATDGQVTQSFTVIDAATCQFKVGGCCKKQLSPTYRGLALVPARNQSLVGKPCSRKPCVFCPNIAISSYGDPALGSTFRVNLNNAPVGSTAYLFGKVGTCGAGLSLSAPFCGIMYGDPGQILLPPIPTTGTTACDGSAGWNLQIPANPGLCGLTLCMQWCFACPSATNVAGLGLSQALQFSITGS